MNAMIFKVDQFQKYISIMFEVTIYFKPNQTFSGYRFFHPINTFN